MSNYFDAAAESATAGVIHGDTAADLLTTHGFPADMTAQMAIERGLAVDQSGFEAAIERHRLESGKGRTAFVVSATRGELPPTDDSHKFHEKPETSVDTAPVRGYIVHSGFRI